MNRLKGKDALTTAELHYRNTPCRRMYLGLGSPIFTLLSISMLCSVVCWNFCFKMFV